MASGAYINVLDVSSVFVLTKEGFLIEYAGMDDNVSIPVAARRIKRTPAALYTAATKGRLKTSEDVFGRILVSMAEALRYKKETKMGRRPAMRR